MYIYNQMYVYIYIYLNLPMGAFMDDVWGAGTTSLRIQTAPGLEDAGIYWIYLEDMTSLKVTFLSLKINGFSR